MPILRSFAFCFVLLFSGCYSTDRMNRYKEVTVAEVAGEQDGISEETVADAAYAMASPDLPAGEVLALNRQTVLALATSYSRKLQTQRDELYRAGLALFGVQRNFGFEVSGTLDFVWSGGEEQDDAERAELAASIERLLPSGGHLRLSATGQSREADESERRDQSTAQIRIDQPLLAGAGYAASHEELVQAERVYVYALRSFTLERQDFAINILREYYDLLGQRKVLENTRTNYQQFVFLRQRSEALFQVNRAPAIDVLRSQQEELSALNRLTTNEESFRIRVGRFLVLLGLSPDWPTELADDIPSLRPVELEEEAAVALSFKRRLDLLTARDQLQDALRKREVAQNAYLPEVNLFALSNWTDINEATNKVAGSSSWQAGIRAEIPFDRRDARDAIRQAELRVDAARRFLQEQEESVTLEVREAYSRLRSLRVTIDVELKNIEIAEKRAKNALLEFRNGRLSNRDVVEAANGLLLARNAYINALAAYEVQRLTLLRQTGLLDVSREGGLIELATE